MKLKSFLKTVAIYLAFAIACFCIVFFYGGSLVRQNVIRTQSQALYREANSIASTYASQYYNNVVTLRDLYTQINVFSDYLDSDIQVISANGKILADSSLGFDGDSTEMPVIDGFDPTVNGGHYYNISTFFGQFDSDQLNVLSPITVSYKVRGYIAVHMPMQSLQHRVDQQINIIYKVYLAVMASAFVLMLLYMIFVQRNYLKITQIAKEYANHRFDHRIKTRNEASMTGQLAASLNSMGVELNTLEDDQRKFISNISHDFRSPLTSIKGYVTAILDGTIPYEMQDKYLNIVIFETDRLTKLTQNILDLNKFASGGMLLDKTDFDINEVIKQTAASFEGIGRQKNLSIDLILTGETMMVNADRDKIQQVLYNLIDNAIKFSNPDSTVTVETTDRGDKLYVSVRDTGVGIPKESLNKIWERFYKTDQSRGRDKKGSGLGLSIVKEIIQCHGENISVISTEHVGTEFTFTLKKSAEN